LLAGGRGVVSWVFILAEQFALSTYMNLGLLEGNTKDDYFTGCNAVHSDKISLIFRSNILLPSSGPKRKSNM
jgi:hypothetical protein